MKDSTNFSFIIKILALVILLIVGYSKNELFPTIEAGEEKFEPFTSESNSSVYFTPLTKPQVPSKMASLTTKK